MPLPCLLVVECYTAELRHGLELEGTRDFYRPSTAAELTGLRPFRKVRLEKARRASGSGDNGLESELSSGLAELIK